MKKHKRKNRPGIENFAGEEKRELAKNEPENSLVIPKEELSASDDKNKSFSLKWQAPEYEHFEKSVSWYWLSLTFTIILVLISIWQRNFIFSLFLVIAWPIIVFISHQPPVMWDFEMDDDAIKVGKNKFYRFAEMYGFDINNYNDDYGELVFKTHSKFNPFLRVRVPIGEKSKVEHFLVEILPREEYPESFSESISKILRF